MDKYKEWFDVDLSSAFKDKSSQMILISQLILIGLQTINLIMVLLRNRTDNLQALISLFLLAYGVVLYIWHYNTWKMVPEKNRSITPKSAIARMFIPFYNFYWLKKSFYGLWEDMNLSGRESARGTWEELPMELPRTLLNFIYINIGIVLLDALLAGMGLYSLIDYHVRLPYNLLPFLFQLASVVLIVSSMVLLFLYIVKTSRARKMLSIPGEVSEPVSPIESPVNQEAKDSTIKLNKQAEDKYTLSVIFFVLGILFLQVIGPLVGFLSARSALSIEYSKKYNLWKTLNLVLLILQGIGLLFFIVALLVA